MRRFLPFAALFGVALVFGCQDLAPVGPDGLEPQFGKPDTNGDHDHGGDDGKESATVTLAGGMTTTGLELVGRNDVQTVTLNTDTTRNVAIVMNFDYRPDDPNMKCTVIATGAGKSDGVLRPVERDYLLDQLKTGVADAGGGGFNLKIDKTDLQVDESTTAEKHHIIFGYDGPEFEGDPVHVMIWHEHDSRISTTVAWVSSTSSHDEFEFTGPIKVAMGGVGGVKGVRGGRAIACGGDDNNPNTVTVTVSQSS